MRKFLTLVAMLSILVFSVGTSQAATSAFDNLPGGAGVFSWQASRNGDYTLVNVQNIADVADTWLAGTSTAVVIHITLYDRDSNHIFDWSCPLSARDNYGFAIQNDAGIDSIRITNDGSPYYPGTVGGIGNCTINYTGIPTTHNPLTGTTALQYGYGTIAISRVDAIVPSFLWRTLYAPGVIDALVAGIPAGNGDGDARNELDLGNRTVVLPDLIFTRTALLGPGYAYAFNGNMLQGFMNMSRIQSEAVASVTASLAAGAGWITVQGVDAVCPAGGVMDWNNDGLFNAGAPLTDFNGIDIHAPELYITNNRTAGSIGIALDAAAAACGRGGRRAALGSADGIYWGRYNVTPGMTETTLFTVAPASNAHALNSALGIADGRAMTVSAYNDNEIPVSVTPLTPPEVGLSPFLSATNAPRPGNFSIGHGGVVAGEGRIVMAAPLFGYVFTTITGVEADLYPLVRNRQAVNVLDLAVGAGGAIVDAAGINNIEYAGF